jgi:hypothetical protein
MGMKILYFDCFSGISGDMILGAFLDMGVPKDVIQKNIENLPLEAFHLEVTKAQRMSIQGRQVRVVVEEDNHARNYREIRSLVENSPLSDKVKAFSLKVFARLAEAESAVHDCPQEEVHFHELGGVDAIVDIVGTALAVEWLNADRIMASELPLGRGFVTCDHGVLPVPAPATVALLKGVPVYGAGVAHELVTPTGAAILTGLSEYFGPIPKMCIEKIGYGVGTRELKERPNVLRVLLGKPELGYEKDTVAIVETNIDDMNPEIFGFVMERLFEEGALDVVWVPISMKKNRPATMIQVVCLEKDRDKVVETILAETTAIGVRHHQAQRTKLPRKQRSVATSFGKIHVKEVSDPAGRLCVVPEYEDCKAIARKERIPLKVVYEAVLKEISP